MYYHENSEGLTFVLGSNSDSLRLSKQVVKLASLTLSFAIYKTNPVVFSNRN